MFKIDLVSKNLLANFFAIVAKEIIEKNCVRKSLTNIAKIAKITNLTRINGKEKRGIVFFMNFKFYFFFSFSVWSLWLPRPTQAP